MNLNSMKQQLETELLHNILKYWQEKVFDKASGQFIGKIDNDEIAHPEYLKASIINARILWTFAAAYRQFPNESYLQIMAKSYDILIKDFWDPENGGIYWSIDGNNQPLDTKKQMYAQAFAIYALSEYYMAVGIEQAKQLAISLFWILERYGFDPEHGGYIEALSADWKEVGDQRLSEKDMDTKKSMNTHLHILEAYTNLYRIWKDEDLKEKLQHTLEVFLDRIVDAKAASFNLFFDLDWTLKSEHRSFGHDIEGSWLIYEAAEVLGDEKLLKRSKKIAVAMAEQVLTNGTDTDGGIFYEGENGKILDSDKHWWPQAEAVVGFFNAWQLSGEEKFLNASVKTWELIDSKFVDHEHGEWYAIVNKEGVPYPNAKVDEWKCPYHNGRFCLELISRINKLRN